MSAGASTSVISVCSNQHAKVWELTSQLLPNFVEADNYTVYVPDSQVEEFLDITNPIIAVLPESALDTGYAVKLKDQINFHNNSERFGWYFQQFLKIEALLHADGEHLVIWESDCVPVKKIKLFDENQRPIFMKGSEYNKEYFLTIENLLGLRRVHSQSFQVPGFPMKKQWLDEFIDAVEIRNDGARWFDAIISSTDLGSQSGFSECETLGTWIANSYPGEYSLSDLAWERFGQSRFGRASKFTPEKLVALGKKENFDAICFENWDTKTPFKRLQQSARLLNHKLTQKN